MVVVGIGDRVVYSLAWLQSATGCDPTSELNSRIGTVVGMEHRWLLVHWDGDNEPTPVCAENLAKPGTSKACSIDADGYFGHCPTCKKPYNQWKRFL